MAFLVLGEPAGAAVVGDAEVAIAWDRPIAHARADAGRIVAWADDTVRWRAPAVCARTQLEVAVQATDGREETFAFSVLPAVRPSPVVVVPSGAPNIWELQGASDSDLTFVVSPGRVEPSPRIGRCARSLWKLPPASHPDVAIVATFEGGSLHGWAALPRPALGTLEVEAPAGLAVTVLVEGRRFFTTADSAGNSRVQVESPPGVTRAEVRWDGGTVPLEMDPPPVTADHRVIAPDGASWLFRTDSRGQPFDGDPLEDAVRIALGAFRLTDAGMAAAEQRPSTPPAGDSGLSGAPQGPDVLSALRAGPSWRASAGGVVDRTFRPGVSVSFGGFVRAGRANVGAGAAALLNGARQRWERNRGTFRRTMVALPLWAEALAPVHVGDWKLVPSLGAGGVASVERVALVNEALATSWSGGPLVTAAFRAGTRRLDFGARAFWSTTPLGLGAPRLSVAVELGWIWTR